jgi:hypothetical protein
MPTIELLANYQTDAGLVTEGDRIEVSEDTAQHLISIGVAKEVRGGATVVQPPLDPPAGSGQVEPPVTPPADQSQNSQPPATPPNPGISPNLHLG